MAVATTGLLSKNSFTDTSEFPGRIEFADVEHSERYDRDQLHIAIRPLTFELHGEKGTGQFHQFYTISKSKRSAFYAFVDALEKSGASVGEPKELVNIVFLWKRTDLEFGKNQDTGEIIKKEGVLLPTKVLGAEEVEKLVAEAKERRGGNGTSANMPSLKASEAVAYTSEELAQVAVAINGATETTAVTKAVKAQLPQRLLQAVVDKSIFPKLVEAGVVSVTDEGKYIAA